MTEVMDVLLEVLTERTRQDEKWGEQNHPNVWDHTPELIIESRTMFGHLADAVKALNDRDEPSDWAGILLEEVYEAIAEADDEKIRAELIQAIAVGVAWVECIDRRSVSRLGGAALDSGL